MEHSNDQPCCSAGGPQNGPRAEHPASHDQSTGSGGHAISNDLLHRMAQGDIKSTESLIEALNGAQTPLERRVLQEWVRAYIEWFDLQASKTAIQGNLPLQEYALLAGIQAVHADQKELLVDYFNQLCNSIGKDFEQGEQPLIEALEYTLQTLDIRVFNGDPVPLVELGKKLLAKLDPTGANFGKASYPSYRSKLYALHLTLVLIRQIDSDWDPTRKDGIYEKFKVRVKQIGANSDYYPIRYHAHLIEQSLCRVASPAVEMERLKDICRQVGQGLKGGVDLVKGLASIGTLQFDFEAFESGYQSLKAAATSQHIRAKHWYEWHQALHHACLSALADPSNYSVFNDWMQKIRSQEESTGKMPDKELCFGIVRQLGVLTLEGRSATVRKAAMEELSSLAESGKHSVKLCWLKDKDVLEGLLEQLVVITVHSGGNEKEAAEVALEILTESAQKVSKRWHSQLWSKHTRQASIQRVIKAWLSDQPLEERLRSLPDPEASRRADSLFSVINSKLRPTTQVNHPAAALLQEVRVELEAHYRELTFVMVPSLFDGCPPKHLDSLQCHLVLIEQIEEVPEAAPAIDQGDGRQSGDNHFSDHYKRLKWVKTQILLEDFFSDRSTKPGEPQHAIQRVLLVGNPGTGKTMLSRKLAYRWAQGEWGQEFEAVYVLPVRALQQSNYDNLSVRREQTLATAVANICFPVENMEEDYMRLRHRISITLELATTLVVLDGLDERCGASERLLDQAKAGKHKLLMLSRPYGIEMERALADVEIEHVGLNENQMHAFIDGEQLPGDGLGLVTFIHDQPGMKEIASIPVNLQILCATWRANQDCVRLETNQFGLYMAFTRYIWERYMIKHKELKLQDKDQEEVFDALGRIAVKGLEQGKMMFSQEFVSRALEGGSGSSAIRDMLKDTGFLLLQHLGQEYQFPHLTFQEYFAGRWVAKQMASDARSEAWAKRLLANHKYDVQYRVMVSFMAGEVVRMQGFDGIKQLLELVDAEPREVVGVQHVLLQVKLLDEWLHSVVEDVGLELFELEQACHTMKHLIKWFRISLARISGGDTENGWKLLSLLTAGLEGSRATAAHAAALHEHLVNEWKDLFDHLDPSIRSMVQKACERAIEITQAGALKQHSADAFNHQNRGVRCAAVRSLTRVIEGAPGHASYSLYEKLLEACRDLDREVRCIAVNGVQRIAEASPEDTPGLIRLLLNALNDSDPDVRWKDLEAIQKIAIQKKVEWKGMTELHGSILDACLDPNSAVRCAALQALGGIVGMAKEQELDWQKPLLHAFQDSNPDVRQTALETIGRVTGVAPKQALDLQHHILHACLDSNSAVRCAALSTLGAMIKIFPDRIVDLQEPLLDASNAPDSEVCKTAIHTQQKIIKVAPKHALGVNRTLINMCWKSNLEVEVCVTAIKGLCKTVRFTPELAPDVLELLLGISKERKNHVLEHVVECVTPLIWSAHEQVLPLKELLLGAWKDPDWSTRYVAVIGVSELVMLSERYVPDLEEVLLNACKDPEWQIQQIAINGLRRVIEIVPGQAWTMQAPILLACRSLSPELYFDGLACLAVIVRAIIMQASNRTEALHDACSNVNWEIRSAALRILFRISSPDFSKDWVDYIDESNMEKFCLMIWGGSFFDDEGDQNQPLSSLEGSLKSACENPSPFIREAAMRDVRRMVTTVPKLAPLLRGVVQRNCEDIHPSVCTMAMRALCKIAEVAPSQAGAIRAYLVRMCEHHVLHTRLSALRGLDIFPIEQLIMDYWTCQERAYGFPLVVKLFDVPLIVKSSPTLDNHCLVLRLYANLPLEWERPRSTVQKLVEHIQSGEEGVIVAKKDENRMKVSPRKMHTLEVKKEKGILHLLSKLLKGCFGERKASSLQSLNTTAPIITLKKASHSSEALQGPMSDDRFFFPTSSNYYARARNSFASLCESRVVYGHSLYEV